MARPDHPSIGTLYRRLGAGRRAMAYLDLLSFWRDERIGPVALPGVAKRERISRTCDQLASQWVANPYGAHLRRTRG